VGDQYATSRSSAGLAIAIATGKTDKSNDTDIKYFIEDSGPENNGYKAETTARAAFKDYYAGHVAIYKLSQYPYCRSSGTLKSGFYCVIANNYRNYANESVTKYAFGFSDVSLDAAEKDAVKELQRRNWSWKESDGYDVEKRGSF